MLMHCPVGGGLGWIKAGRSPGYNLAAQHIATAFRPDIGIDKVGGHLIPIRILLMDVDGENKKQKKEIAKTDGGLLDFNS
ncbi:hypothetical protein TWF569_006519 [Orbilia oligospora]|nr:hypothetical protein TWF569_006519 [Orbilia oligospora]KAF3152518.1 hypothetical protein TWF594_004198 [Orbilia oligospora]